MNLRKLGPIDSSKHYSSLRLTISVPLPLNKRVDLIGCVIVRIADGVEEVFGRIIAQPISKQQQQRRRVFLHIPIPLNVEEGWHCRIYGFQNASGQSIKVFQRTTTLLQMIIQQRPFNNRNTRKWHFSLL